MGLVGLYSSSTSTSLKRQISTRNHLKFSLTLSALTALGIKLNALGVSKGSGLALRGRSKFMGCGTAAPMTGCVAPALGFRVCVGGF